MADHIFISVLFGARMAPGIHVFLQREHRCYSLQFVHARLSGHARSVERATTFVTSRKIDYAGPLQLQQKGGVHGIRIQA